MGIIKFIKSLFVRVGGDVGADRPILALYSDGRVVYNEDEFGKMGMKYIDKFEVVVLGLLRAVYVRGAGFRGELNYRAQAEADVREFLEEMGRERAQKAANSGILVPNPKIVRPGRG